MKRIIIALLVVINIYAQESKKVLFQNWLTPRQGPVSKGLAVLRSSDIANKNIITRESLKKEVGPNAIAQKIENNLKRLSSNFNKSDLSQLGDNVATFKSKALAQGMDVREINNFLSAVEQRYIKLEEKQNESTIKYLLRPILDVRYFLHRVPEKKDTNIVVGSMNNVPNESQRLKTRINTILDQRLLKEFDDFNLDALISALESAVAQKINNPEMENFWNSVEQRYKELEEKNTELLRGSMLRRALDIHRLLSIIRKK